MHPKPPLLRHLGSLTLALALAAAALVPAARAAVMLAPLDSRPKDFAFIKKDGVYHLFYIRHNDYLPPFATEVDFGHAVSTDLYHWTQLAPVMGVDPFGWDNLHMWAPHIVEQDGLYWMFYTGVTEATNGNANLQSIGLAVSSDLMTWTRATSAPIWTTQSTPWAWWQPRSSEMACRDPFVMEDPAAPGQWLMYYTATPASDTATTLIGVARSPAGELSQWTDEKPLWITHQSWSFNALTESPHLFEHNGRWFMFISTNAGQPLSFYTGANPLGDPLQWTYRGRLRNMLGFDTSFWFASEELRDGIHDLFAFCAGDRIEIRRIVWGIGDNFSLSEPAFFHMVRMNWSRPSVREHEQVGLLLKASNGFAFDRRLVAFVRDSSGAEIPAPLDSLGLPEQPLPRSDSMVVKWFARRWPSTLDPRQPMQLRVAVDDATASTPWLLVSWNPIQGSTQDHPGGSEPVPPPNEFPPADPGLPEVDTTLVATPSASVAAANGALRVLPHSPLGPGPAVAFELPAAGEARVEVFDLQGRRVARLAERAFGAGVNVLAWDGRDASGVRARRGLYFVRLSTAERVLTARLLLDR